VTVLLSFQGSPARSCLLAPQHDQVMSTSSAGTSNCLSLLDDSITFSYLFRSPTMRHSACVPWARYSDLGLPLQPASHSINYSLREPHDTDDER